MVQKIKTRAAALGIFTTAMLLGTIALAEGSFASSDPVASGFTDMNGKVTTYGGYIVALVLLSVGIFLGIKYLRKGVSKA